MLCNLSDVHSVTLTDDAACVALLLSEIYSPTEPVFIPASDLDTLLQLADKCALVTVALCMHHPRL